jgi:diadenosine tetraphosphatase ApaH/serine/threonine PP2A family protein phosphatase
MPDPIYTIPDIHGHSDKLDRALDLVEQDGGRDAEIVFLGDLADRGPDSRGVIERLSRGVAEGRNWRVLKGNHDRMFSWFLHGGVMHDPKVRSGVGWFDPMLGGLPTLESYGIDDAAVMPYGDLFHAARAAVPARHLAFIDSLSLYHECNGVLFAHAGVRPETPLVQQTELDLIWIREPFLSYSGPHPWLVVHGHTALKAPRHFGNRIDLDGGTGYGRALRPAVFEGCDCWLLTDQGRVALRP